MFKIAVMYIFFSIILNAIGYYLGVFSVFNLFSVICILFITVVSTLIVLFLLILAMLMDEGRGN